jgi:hypothetical protein
MVLFRHALMATAVAAFCPMSAGWAAELAPASGPIILTVIGKIENANRPAFDAFEDPFINYHDREFESAAEFDAALLEGLGMQEVEVGYEGWPRSVVLAGPLLTDVLAAVGAEPSNLTMLALDGFAVELTAEDIAAEEWIVAIKQDGDYMGVGQRGPTWIVYSPGEDNTITADDEGRWPWAAFLLDVE